MASNKENMRQAMKELLGLVGMTKEDQPRAEDQSTAETDLKTTQQEVAQKVESGFFQVEPKVTTEPKVTAPKAAPVFGTATRYVPPVEEPVGAPMEEAERPPFIRPSATVIAAGTSFFGDLRAEGDVEVLGKLKGNLEATGNVRISGKVLGDVKGAAVALVGCAVQGNITSTSTVTLDEGAMVVGDILATDIESDGKVKGNLQIARSATFMPGSVLAGNVTASTIAMSQGARIQGSMRIAEDPETNALFGDGLEI